jgi:hypothetical protein
MTPTSCCLLRELNKIHKKSRSGCAFAHLGFYVYADPDSGLFVKENILFLLHFYLKYIVFNNRSLRRLSEKIHKSKIPFLCLVLEPLILTTVRNSTRGLQC